MGGIVIFNETVWRMRIRYWVLILVVLAGCKSDLINCPDHRPLKLKRSNPFALRHQRPQDLDVSASSKSLNNRELQRLKSKDDSKKDISIEEWDCPRPGAQKNKRLVKDTLRKMEKRQRDEERHKQPDTLSVYPSGR
jgi:hypothetical protein